MWPSDHYQLEPARKPSCAPDCDDSDNECTVISCKNRPPFDIYRQVSANQGYSNNSGSYSNKRKGPTSKKGRPVPSKTVTPTANTQAKIKVSTKHVSRPIDETLFDSSPKVPKVSLERSQVPMAAISDKKAKAKTPKNK